MTDNRADRHDRLRNALRENLKRRKAQAKGRAGTADAAADDATLDPKAPDQPDRRADTKRYP